MKIIVFLGLMVTSLLGWAASAEEVRKVRFHNEVGRYTDADFTIMLLKLILSKSDQEFELVGNSDPSITEPRARKMLEDGELDLAWVGTTPDFERRNLPVYIPLMRGLIGVRVFLIHEASQPLFSSVKTLDQLKPLIGLLGTDWGDIPIMAEAGLTIETAKFERLFQMLGQRRGDYFSRGVTEVGKEYQEWSQKVPNLAIEKRLAFVYKYPMLFFVSKKNPELHAVIDRGFRAAYDDGSYMDLFNSHPEVGGALERLNMANRLVIRIENSNISPAVKNIPDKYWHEMVRSGS